MFLLLAPIIFYEKLAVVSIISLYVVYCISLATFRIFAFYMVFLSFVMKFLSRFSLHLSCVGFMEPLDSIICVNNLHSYGLLGNTTFTATIDFLIRVEIDSISLILNLKS